MKLAKVLLLLLSMGCCVAWAQLKQPAKRPPNIIFIVADDLGYGDISCYGQQRFKTPNIDRLAAEGIKFTQGYAGTAVCAPSRSSFFTGQHTGHTPIRGNLAVKPEGQYPLPDSSRIIPQLLKQAGYATGCFGKWGLGGPGSSGDPVNKGIDEFFGYNSQTLAHNYYPYYLWHNREKVLLPENSGSRSVTYAPELIQRQLLAFIEKNQAKPFALFMTTVIPHAELAAPPAYMRQAIGKYGPEKPFIGADTSSPGFTKAGPALRKIFTGPFILNGGYTQETAEQALANNEADLIAFGVPYIANPDLVERFEQGAALNQPDQATFYGGDDKGYIDYPSLKEEYSGLQQDIIEK